MKTYRITSDRGLLILTMSKCVEDIREALDTAEKELAEYVDNTTVLDWDNGDENKITAVYKGVSLKIVKSGLKGYGYESRFLNVSKNRYVCIDYHDSVAGAEAALIIHIDKMLSGD